jgi:hypothetical protein
MGLPTECDQDKIAEAAIGLMYLTLHGNSHATRAWKSIDWDVLNLLHSKGWIFDPINKAKSVLVTEEGQEHAKLMFEKHFHMQGNSSI